MIQNRYGALLALATCAILSSVSAAAVRIGIVETRDNYTRTLGLGAFLGSEGLTHTDLSEPFESGRPPALASIDCLIVGSFVTNDAEKKATYIGAATALRDFVAGGGTVIVLCQADQDMREENWMPAPRTIRRDDPDCATVYPLQSAHALLNTPEKLRPEDLTGWTIATRSDITGFEAFTTFTQGAVVLGGNTAGTMQTLLEMEWGKGRALFYAMALDKATSAGNDAAKSGATKLLRNALHYAQWVEDGQAPPVHITPSGAYTHAIAGTVYMDNNRNSKRDAGEPGRAGVGVSDGVDVVLTDPSGQYRLPNAGQNAPFVYVTQPSDAAKSATAFYQFPTAADTQSTRFDFPLWPADAETSRSRAYFAQVTDVHTGNATDCALEREAFQEIYRMTPPVDFVVSTGDLLNNGSNISEWENYLPAVKEANVPFFNVIGNHDINGGGNPVRNYRVYFGPDYYSFDQGGVHFVVRNSITPSAQQDAWLQKDLAALAGKQPVVFFQHYPPTAEELAQLDQWNVHSIYTGHWHSEKAVKSATTASFNSPTAVMGGIDCSPAGFQLITLGRDGSLAKEWRYGRVSRKMVVVSPPPDGRVNAREFPIVANLYDTTARIVDASWWVEASGKAIARGPLTQESAWSWTGRFSAPGNRPAQAQMHVGVRDNLNRVWTTAQSFQMDTQSPATPQTSGDWPMFMGGPTHEGAAKSSLAVPLRLAWSVCTEGDLDYSSPILAEGKLFMALKARHTSTRNGLVAIDPASGKILWRCAAEQAINHTPAYHAGMICIAEVGGRVYGVNARSGSIVWKHDLLDNLGRYNYCAPCADGDAFYVGTLKCLACLDAKTGNVRWEGPVPGAGDTDWLGSYGSPAVWGGRVALGGMVGRRDNLYVMNEDTGEAKWSHPADSGMHGSPAISGGKVLFSGRSSRLYCYDLNHETQPWNASLGTGWSGTTPAIKDETVVAGSGDGIMKGLHLSTGEELWSHTSDTSVLQISPYRRDWRGLLSSPTIAGDQVYFGSSDGYLYCLDLATGKERWKYRIGVPILSTPLVSGNALFVGAYDGRLYAFTAAPGM